jgi:hypothetical protein
MSRHERIAVYADHLHVDEFECMDGNGLTQIPVIYSLTGDEDGYYMARLLGAWFGDMWLNRNWFCAAHGSDHIEKCESLMADAFDRGRYPNEPQVMPKGEKN